MPQPRRRYQAKVKPRAGLIQEAEEWWNTGQWKKDPLNQKPAWWPKDLVSESSPYLWNKLMLVASKAPTISIALESASYCYDDIKGWVDRYDTYERFKIHWKKLRHCIGLQARLIAEQVLFDKGEPWSQLCTGFKSIGQKGPASESRVRASALPRSGATPSQGASVATGSASAYGVQSGYRPDKSEP